jgi:sec-independent protein translocase protein TatA
VFTGLASPSHLIIVLVIILLLFGAKRIPELAKGLGSGIKEFREDFTARLPEFERSTAQPRA